jgi:transposase-like protein
MVALAEQPLEPAPKNKGGRPLLYNEQRVKMLCEAIEQGLSYSRAADLVGITGETVSAWKERYPEFSEAIARAEATFLLETAKKLSSAKTMAGSADPKALELLLRRFPEFRQHQEVTQTTTNLNVSVQLNSDQLTSLHSRHIERLKQVSVQDISQPLLTGSDTGVKALPPA